MSFFSQYGLTALKFGGTFLGGLILGGVMMQRGMQKMLMKQMPGMDPAAMQAMMNPKAMQGVMNNPNAMQGIMNNPEMQAMMQDPQLQAMMKDPKVMQALQQDLANMDPNTLNALAQQLQGANANMGQGLNVTSMAPNSYQAPSNPMMPDIKVKRTKIMPLNITASQLGTGRMAV